MGSTARRQTSVRRVVRVAVAAACYAIVLVGCGGRDAPTAPQSLPAQAMARRMPMVTPGPQAQFVRDVVTATGVDQHGAPVNPTTLFSVAQPVYVVCRVHGVIPGLAHRLTIRWYLQGQQPQTPGTYSYVTVTQDGLVSFDVVYAAAGEGMARLYWDEPVADNTDRPNEHFLAQAIAFTVQESQATASDVGAS